MDVLTMGRSWWITQILAMKSALLLAYQHINGIPSLPYPSIQRKSRIWTVKPRETWKGFIWFEKKNIESFFEFIYIKNSCMTSAKIWNSYSAVLPARQLTISLVSLVQFHQARNLLGWSQLCCIFFLSEPTLFLNFANRIQLGVKQHYQIMTGLTLN